MPMAQYKPESKTRPALLPTISIYFDRLSISFCVYFLVLYRKTAWPWRIGW